ncbi:MAG TPA: DUF3592 domain-containing protein [Allosphingosinicella sp.]|jgi:hypothetical protein
MNLLILALLALAGAVVLAVLHFRQAGPAKAARHWPVAPGVMVATRVDDPAPGGAMRWHPLVHYRYRVGEQDYEGVQLRPGGATATSRHEAEAMVARYAPGAQVGVRFNPYRPEESALEVPPSNPLLLIGAGALALLGLVPFALIAAEELDLFGGDYRPPVSPSSPTTTDMGMGTDMNMTMSTTPPAPTTAYFVGLWTEDGNCYPAALSMQSDGVFRTRGGGRGTWYVLGTSLTLSGPAGSRTLPIQIIDQNNYRAVGAPGTTARCSVGTAPS